jgi:hypothetical protein
MQWISTSRHQHEQSASHGHDLRRAWSANREPARHLRQRCRGNARALIIVPEEQNALINPAHPDACSISAMKVRRWFYDPRLSSQ